MFIPTPLSLLMQFTLKSVYMFITLKSIYMFISTKVLILCMHACMCAYCDCMHTHMLMEVCVLWCVCVCVYVQVCVRECIHYYFYQHGINKDFFN